MMVDEVISKQIEICKKIEVDFSAVPFDSIIGVALETFEDSSIPVNGLRHPAQKDEYSGWYIWAGDYSASANFFKPMHVKHLLDIYPRAINYLGLPAGWRFLIDDGCYEDIWYDENLLEI